MKYLKNIGIAICTIIYCSLSSCDYLNVDKYFTDTLVYDSIFQSKYSLEKYLWATASLFPDEGRIWENSHTPGVVASDEAFVQWDENSYPGVAFILGKTSPDNLGAMNIWPNMYKIIRKANIIFRRIDECVDLSSLDKQEIVGYAHFLRGYAYHMLLQNFGPLVLVGDEPMETNETPEYYNKARATYDETVDYICNELETAARYIPLRVTVSQFGRPTKGAAYGLIARLRLQQASPMFNGGSAAKTTFGSWVRSTDKKHYISQEYDEKKWAIAAHAAKRVIDLGIYDLHTVKADQNTPMLPNSVSHADFPDGAGGIDPYKSYSEMFNGESPASKNPEYVWGRMSSSVTGSTKSSFPINMMGGTNGMAIPQKIVDAFYMVDGRDRNNSSKEYPYTEDGFTTTNQSFSEYELRTGVNNMYVNREARFYASIGFSGCHWPCNSTSDATKKNVIAYYWRGATGNAASGKDMTAGNITNYPVTGYVIKKFIHKDDAWNGAESVRIQKSFGIIRYAEILLGYVEALNNLTASHPITFNDESTGTYSRDMNEMARYFNMIRYRAGLPGLTNAELAYSKDGFFDILKREYMIEFLHENRRYFDVRRWGIYMDVDIEPIAGMNTDGFKEDYFQRVITNHSTARNRVTDKKMIFLPISQSEMRKVPLMDQNFGWDN